MQGGQLIPSFWIAFLGHPRKDQTSAIKDLKRCQYSFLKAWNGPNYNSMYNNGTGSDFTKIWTKKYLRPIKRETVSNSWLEMGGNKYFGVSSVLKGNMFISGSAVRLRNTHPLLVYRALWHTFVKPGMQQWKPRASLPTGCFLKEWSLRWRPTLEFYKHGQCISIITSSEIMQVSGTNH